MSQEIAYLRTCRKLDDNKSNHRLLALSAQADVAAIREEELQGQQYMVVPIIALIEGVIFGSNAENPELALASEFGKAPVTWNGRPITLGHPKRNGQFVSASQTPKIFEAEQLGFIFNTTLDGTKLKLEAWIDKAKVAASGPEVIAQIDRLQSGEIVEVSTGLFTDLETENGVYNGKPYTGIWRNVVPDHLAILTEGEIGACSVEQGCGGPRINQGKDPADPTDCGCNKKTQEDPSKQKKMQEGLNVLKGALSLNSTFKLTNNSTDTISDEDVRVALSAALKIEYEGCWDVQVVAVFSCCVVYMVNWDGRLLQRDYSISTDDSITLVENEIQVRPETKFVPIIVKEDTMTEPTVNEADKVAAVATETATATQTAETAAPAQPTVNAKTTVESFLASAPEGIREVLSEGLRLQNDKRNSLVAELKANKNNTFDEAELKTMSMSMLEKMSRLAKIDNYAGAAGGTTELKSNSAAEEAYTPATKMFQ